MRAALVALTVILASAGLARAEVPQTVPFAARLVDDTTGDAMTGTQRLAFELFDAATAGTSQWVEARDVDVSDGGLVYLDLGETKPFGDVFTGKRLWLSVKVGDTTLEPRISLASVPYAIKSGASDSAVTIGGLTADQLQKRVTGTCDSASFVTAINPDGTVTCTLGATGTGDITSVIAGTGLAGGAAGGDATLSLLQCGANQILKSDGATWSCQADAVNPGDITGVIAGTGLAGGATSGDATLSLITSCASGQVLKWTGAAWACANDIDTDTNSGGDVTSVTTSAASGLVGGGTSGDLAISLTTTCTTGQVLKWNGGAWVCANDIDTNSGGTITGVLAGLGLTGGGSAGNVTLTVALGAGLTFLSGAIGLDTAFADARYVKKAGDTMTGSLGLTGGAAINMNGGNVNMVQGLVTNRGCLTGYTRHGPGLCLETNDSSGFTFATCANHCRIAGTHMCTGGEMRAVLQSGVTISGGLTFDWVDDQDADDSAMYINANTAENPDTARATTTSSFCRCCQSTE